MLSSPPSFGRYEVLFPIAAGGMAEVYAACQRGEAGFARTVAVKRMLPHLSRDPDFVDMFFDEARVAASIQSPHVVQTLDLGRADDGTPYLVMELVVGVTLAQLLGDCVRANESIPAPLAAEILAQAALGLHDAHEARLPTGALLGIVHRDISPQNILIGRDGRARVSDFGVAHALHRRTTTITGEVKGKYAYFSPEQARAETLDRRSDIFALAVCAWETLAQQRLFRSSAGNIAILEAVKSKPIPRLSDVRPDLPAALVDVVHRGLERDREARYPTAEELAQALRLAVDGGTPRVSSQDVARALRHWSGRRIEKMQTRLEEAMQSLGLRESVPASVPTAPIEALTAPATPRSRPQPASPAPAIEPSRTSSPSSGAWKTAAVAIAALTLVLTVAGVAFIVGTGESSSGATPPVEVPDETAPPAIPPHEGPEPERPSATVEHPEEVTRAVDSASPSASSEPDEAASLPERPVTMGGRGAHVGMATSMGASMRPTELDRLGGLDEFGGR